MTRQSLNRQGLWPNVSAVIFDVEGNARCYSSSEIELTHWGAEMARKGGIPKARVLNCVSGPEWRRLAGRCGRPQALQLNDAGIDNL